MAKYVCDFETVTAAGEKLCKAATDINTAIGTYSSSIDSNLSSWDGTAKSSFEKSNTTHISTAKKDATEVNELGEFVKKASKSIKSLEDELAALKI